MIRADLLDISIPLREHIADFSVVVANCGAVVKNPVAVACADSSLGALNLNSCLGRVCGYCLSKGFEERRYQYLILSGQEALTEGLVAP